MRFELCTTVQAGQRELIFKSDFNVVLVEKTQKSIMFEKKTFTYQFIS
jgi:hypothetical protein